MNNLSIIIKDKLELDRIKEFIPQVNESDLPCIADLDNDGNVIIFPYSLAKEFSSDNPLVSVGVAIDRFKEEKFWTLFKELNPVQQKKFIVNLKKEKII